MKTSRFRYSYRKSASKLHKRIGDTLRASDLFNGHEIYQEYPVERVLTTYQHSGQHFDWCIPGMKVVIEAHGKQHYEVVNFGGTEADAIAAFQSGKRRDKAKKYAAEEAGFRYIEVPYTDFKRIDDNYLMDKILNAPVFESEPVEKKKSSFKYDKERSKQIRHEQYLKRKEWKHAQETSR